MNARSKIRSPGFRGLSGFSLPIIRILAKHGITNVREFVSLAQLHECHQGLRRILGKTEVEMDAMLAAARGRLPTSEGQLTPTPIPLGKLGCAIDGRQQASRQSSEQKGRGSQIKFRHQEGLPETISLIEKFQPIRDQGERGTCVAHALVAAREYTLNTSVDLSEQFLYWDCKQHDGHDGPGTYVSTGIECLESDGVCDEASWPYNPKPGDDEGQGPPPEGCAENAKQYSDLSHADLGGDLEEIKSCLAFGTDGCGLPVAIAIPVFPSWANAETSRSGKVFMPFEEEEALGGHAIILVGYADNPEAPGGGYFIFRNSWGSAWAAESEASAGYGFLPYAYVRDYGCCHVAITASAKQALCRPSNLETSMKPSRFFLWTILGVLVAAAIFLLVQPVTKKGFKLSETYAVHEEPKSDPDQSAQVGEAKLTPSLMFTRGGRMSDQERLQKLMDKLKETLLVLQQG